jgi:hypothetical protein
MAENTMIDFLIYRLRGSRYIRSLDEKEFQDIQALWKLRVLNVTAKGRSITEIYVDVRNRCDKPLNVFIPVGTFFRSRGAHQNMAVRKETVFAIEAGGTRFLNVPATCINAARPVPGREDSFRGVDRVSAEVERFLKETERMPPMVVQAGVWALTDGYGRERIKERLVSVSARGESRSSISDLDVDRAKAILDNLGLSTPLN